MTKFVRQVEIALKYQAAELKEKFKISCKRQRILTNSDGSVRTWLKKSIPDIHDSQFVSDVIKPLEIEELITGSGRAKLLVPNSKSGATSAKWSLAPEMLWHQNSTKPDTSAASSTASKSGNVFLLCMAIAYIGLVHEFDLGCSTKYTPFTVANYQFTGENGGQSVQHEVLLFEALQEGLEEEMARDPTVCVMGEDVGHYGGSYKVTKGIAKKFGDLRCLDTPIAENAFTGMGIGAAMMGLRPIIEGMNMGFLLLAFNQISNNCGMLHYTSGGQFKIPVVIRGPGGVGRQLGAEHSQRLESYFQSIPGIQMVACSTPYNAKGLMKAAIRSDNPVILFEHVLLYNLKETIPDEDYVLNLEEAEMVRPGEHITILTYSRMRSLKPFDLHTIGNSIKKTHSVLIVEECMRTGGIGASLTAAINENFQDYLDTPIVCLSSQDVPTPYAGTLEEWTVVQPPQIVAAVEQMCQ
ncbi:pyruvate dehydrogenase E1 component subunit beta-3, chloroplastic-like protein [Tanacetum coccineum]